MVFLSKVKKKKNPDESGLSTYARSTIQCVEATSVRKRKGAEGLMFTSCGTGYNSNTSSRGKQPPPTPPGPPLPSTTTTQAPPPSECCPVHVSTSEETLCCAQPDGGGDTLGPAGPINNEAGVQSDLESLGYSSDWGATGGGGCAGSSWKKKKILHTHLLESPFLCMTHRQASWSLQWCHRWTQSAR